MAAHRFWMDWPSSSPTPYGNRTRSTLPAGIKEVAINSNSWGAATQLVAFLASPYYGNYVECSFTYAKNIPNISEGWYFWRGYLSVTGGKIWEHYEPIAYTSSPVGHDIILTLFNSNGTWFASYQDNTSGVLNSYQIQQAPNGTLYLGTSGGNFHRMGIETGSSSCSDYSSFVSEQYTKFKYLDQFGNETSQNPTATVAENSLTSCINMDKPSLKISHA